MKHSRKGFHRHALAAAVVLALAGTAQAQLSTATLKGHVAAAGAGQAVVAVNKDNGHTYKTTTLADGGYVLTGLAPGSYTIRVGNGSGQDITLAVGETASLDLGGGTQQVTVVGSLQRKDVKNSEASTAVSKRQIETLPQVNRNFLAFADLAPGVRFVADPATGYTRIQGGAQGSDRVNVFIDGMSQKNDLTRGGIAGQNESRGNPFPQSAIAEYKVITQNYKAEYGAVSSTAITAVTKSGTNTIKGDAFFDYAAGDQIAYSPFEKQAEASGLKRPSPKQAQFGVSIGGAIVQDKIHYFLAYEGKDNSIPSQMAATNLTGVTVTPWLTSNVLAKQWATDRPFHEDLLFAKLNVVLGDDDRLEFSAKLRTEKDRGSLQFDDHPDWGFSTPSNVLHRTQEENRLNAKWERTGDRWVNEANAELFYSKYIPESVNMDPFVEYKRMNWSGVMLDGRMEGRSRNKQNSFTLKDDFTYTGHAGHVIKTGASLNQSTYEVGGSRWAVPHYFVFITDAGVPGLVGDPGMPGPDANNPAGADKFYPGWEPFSTTGTPARYAKYKNNKFGIYLQDDIAVSKDVELNVGLRWDYEDNAFNNAYVTPTFVRDKFSAVDTRTGAAPGQTYAESLAKGGVNLNDYISTGKERKAYKGAIQPRLGASWDVKGDKSTVLVAGMGRAYDRTPAIKARDELINNAYINAGGAAYEFWLLNNKLAMPYSDQFGLTLRQAAGDWQTEIGVQQVYGYNEFNWVNGGRSPDGSLPTGSPWFDGNGGGPDKVGKLLLGESNTRTRTDSVSLKADKPYTKASGWSASVALNVSRGYTTAGMATAESSDANQYNWAAGHTFANTMRRSIDVEPYRLVTSFTTDLPWGLTFGAKATYGGKTKFQINECLVNPPAGCDTRLTDANHFEQVDLMLSKEVAITSTNKVALRLDVVNLFNKANYGKYNTWGGWGSPDPNVGKPTALAGQMRTLKVGLKVDF